MRLSIADIRRLVLEELTDDEEAAANQQTQDIPQKGEQPPPKPTHDDKGKLQQSALYGALKKGAKMVRVFAPNSGKTWDVVVEDGRIKAYQVEMKRVGEPLVPANVDELLKLEQNWEISHGLGSNTWVPGQKHRPGAED